MKTPSFPQVFAIAALTLMGFCGTAFADGLRNNEVEFAGQITSAVVNGDGGGTLFIRLDTFDLRVIVNPRTRILDDDGDPLTIEQLARSLEGPTPIYAEVAGKFSSSGILATSVRVSPDAPDKAFELRGHITRIQNSGNGTLVSLLGIQIVVNSLTTIRWDGVDTPASDLKIGMAIEAEGLIGDDGVWTASAVKVLAEGRKRQYLRFEGTVVSYDATAGLVIVDVAGATANETQVHVDAGTRIEGNLEPGVLVLVVGVLNADLSVTAREVVVLAALEIKPDERKLKVGESAVFTVKLRETAAADVKVNISVAPGDVVELSATSVTIPAGSQTEDFSVKALKAGSAVITAMAGNDEATAEVRVGEVSEDDDDGSNPVEARIAFAPDHIRMGPNDTREVVLLIKPPQKSAVKVEYSFSGVPVEVLGERDFSNGAAALKVTIKAGPSTGTASVVAKLPEELGGGVAELLVEIQGKNGNDTSNQRVQLDFRPDQLRLRAGDTRTAELLLDRPLAEKVTVELTQEGSAVEVVSLAEIPAGQRAVGVSVKGTSEGKSTILAALPAALGGDTAKLEVDVRK